MSNISTIPADLEAEALEIIEAKKALDDKENALKERIMDVMVQRGEKNIRGQHVTAILGNRVTYTAQDIKQVTKSFLKFALDTARISDYEKLNNRVPAHVSKKVSKYVTLKEK